MEQELIGEDEALARVSGAQLARLMFPRFEAHVETKPLAHGVPAVPGAAVGAIAFDSAEAVRRAATGERVILVRRETTPDDLPGMVAAEAVLTSRGGEDQPRGRGGARHGQGVRVRRRGTDGGRRGTDARRRPDRARRRHGDLRGRHGGHGPARGTAADRLAGGRFLDTGEHDGALTDAVARTLEHADSVRRLGVGRRQDTPRHAAHATAAPAEIGLCRADHVPGERESSATLVEAMILAEEETGRRAALDALLPLQRADFAGILAAMNRLPVTIRLIDPPLHEFLPDRTELAVRVATHPTAHDRRLLAAVRRVRERPDARAARRAPSTRRPRAGRDAGTGDRRSRRRARDEGDPGPRGWSGAAGRHGQGAAAGAGQPRSAYSRRCRRPPDSRSTAPSAR